MPQIGGNDDYKLSGVSDSGHGLANSQITIKNAPSIFSGAHSQGSGQESVTAKTKKSYLYCIDTRQITSMIDYSIHMMNLSMKHIEMKA